MFKSRQSFDMTAWESGSSGSEWRGGFNRRESSPQVTMSSSSTESGLWSRWSHHWSSRRGNPDRRDSPWQSTLRSLRGFGFRGKRADTRVDDQRPGTSAMSDIGASNISFFFIKNNKIFNIVLLIVGFNTECHD